MYNYIQFAEIREKVDCFVDYIQVSPCITDEQTMHTNITKQNNLHKLCATVVTTSQLSVLSA